MAASRAARARVTDGVHRRAPRCGGAAGGPVQQERPPRRPRHRAAHVAERVPAGVGQVAAVAADHNAMPSARNALQEQPIRGESVIRGLLQSRRIRGSASTASRLKPPPRDARTALTGESSYDVSSGPARISFHAQVVKLRSAPIRKSVDREQRNGSKAALFKELQHFRHFC